MYRDLEWPPRSPDLTVPDFFLWGYLKIKVYASKPKTIDELKCNMRTKIAAITPEMLANVMQNTVSVYAPGLRELLTYLPSQNRVKRAG